MTPDIKMAKVVSAEAGITLVTYSKAEETPFGVIEVEVTIRETSKSLYLRYQAHVRLVREEGSFTLDVMQGATKTECTELIEAIAEQWITDMLSQGRSQAMDFDVEPSARRFTVQFAGEDSSEYSMDELMHAVDATNDEKLREWMARAAEGEELSDPAVHKPVIRRVA